MIIYKQFRGLEESELLPFDEESERFYRKIVAGFVPAGARGGALCAVAMEWVLRPPAAIFWLGEAQSSNTDDLILKAFDMKSQFKVEEFVGWIDDDFSRYLSHRNAVARDQRKPELQVLPAPNTITGNIAYHVAITRALLNPTNKLLSLGESKSLRASLQELSKSEIDSATAKEHPLLAALCYAVSSLEVNQPDYGVQRPTSYTENSKYDELNYGNGNRLGTYKTDYNDLDY